MPSSEAIKWLPDAMRPSLTCLTVIALLSCQAVSSREGRGVRIRQEDARTTAVLASTVQSGSRSSSAPTLRGTGEPAATSEPETRRSSDEAGSRSRTDDVSAIASPSSTSERESEPTEEVTSTTTESDGAPSTIQTQIPQDATEEAASSVELPIEPRITPAFGVAGVVLILTGLVYTLVGVKHRLIQVLLSNGYLAALAVTVLIDYVMKPPVRDAVQGAYFVAAFMTGCIYGGGSLIFKEITEGFGCMLGGFCFSMWFLCLKPGGLVTNQAGKGVMIGIFSVLAWSLSFSHYTRNWGLIGSTSFAGATAFVLGIDCFSQAGLKESWFYIWQLNDNLFPLQTRTYPITRGMIVELIVILLITVIGVLSQMKLWKIVRERRSRRDAVKLDDERRKEVVEEAIGRHLERQNDRDRSNWEKQYGNVLTAKRSTILWSDAHPDKAVTHIMPVEDKRFSSVETLEMATIHQPRSKYASQMPRQSTISVNAIPEEEEDPSAYRKAHKRTASERLKALAALDPSVPAPSDDRSESSASQHEQPDDASADEKVVNLDMESDGGAKKWEGPEVVPLPFTVPSANVGKSGSDTSPKSARLPDHLTGKAKRNSTALSKRDSLRSILSRSTRRSVSSEQPAASESVEHLILPSQRSSRASSLAATLDEENDRFSLVEDDPSSHEESLEPGAELSSAEASSAVKVVANMTTFTTQPVRPVSITESTEDFEEDPEALHRSIESTEQPHLTKTASTVSESSRRQDSDSSETRPTTAHASDADGLTQDALKQMPKHTSHVVLSYRTNEWAKHIADADEPVFAEPEQMEDADVEAPVQLAAPQPGCASGETKASTASSKPPPPHIASASQSGIVANVESSRATLRSSIVPAVSTASSALPARPLLKGKRSSNIVGMTTIAGTPIDENAVTDFQAPQQKRLSSAPSLPVSMTMPAMPQRVMSSTSLSSTPSAMQSRPVSSVIHHPYMLNRSISSTGLSYHHNDPPTRSLTALSPTQNPYANNRLSRSSTTLSVPAMLLPQALRSDTRLGSYESRQPQQRDLTTEQQRRESMLAEWRLSQQSGGLINQIPADSVERQRAQMLMDREHKRMMEEKEKAGRQQHQAVMDQVMRRPEMQDAHREAMRRMQRGANRALGSCGQGRDAE